MICGKRRPSKGNMLPRKSSFFRTANKSLALAPDLIGIYFGFFFFWKRKRKSIQEQSIQRTAQTLPMKKSKKGQKGAAQKILMTILG
jgi:hypothetical protein